MTHTPTIPALPWRLGGCSGRMIYDRQGFNVSDVDLLSNAEFIIKAVNNHDSLVAIAKRLVERGWNATVTDMAKEALKKVGE